MSAPIERMKALRTPQSGDLRVWHVPQIPMSGFYVYVESKEEAVKVLAVLAEYDLFQYEQRVKGDYSNMQGLEVCVEASNDGEEDHKCFEWEEWIDEQGYSINEQKGQET